MSAKPGVFVQGIGYKVPSRSKTHDPRTGVRVKRVSNETLNAMRVLKSSRIPKERTDARRTIYHDAAVMCSKEELEEFNLLGAPICYEHDTSKKIGVILNYNVIGDTGDMSLTASITDPEWQSKISLGEFDAQFFSINYDFRLDGEGHVINKRFKELSLVKKPYYNGCDMGFYAGSRQGVTASLLDVEESSNGVGDDVEGTECFVVFLNDETSAVKEGDDGGFYVSVRCSHEAGLQIVSDHVPSHADNDMDVEQQKPNEAMTTPATVGSGQFATNNAEDVSTSPDNDAARMQQDSNVSDNNAEVDMTDADPGQDEGMDELSALRRQLAEAKSANAKFLEANRKATTELTKSMFDAIEFNPSNQNEGANFKTDDAQKVAQAMRRMCDEDPSTMSAFKAYMDAFSANKTRSSSAGQVQKTVSFSNNNTNTNEAPSATPLKNNGVAKTTKNNGNMHMASEKPALHEVKKPGFNLQQNKTGFFNSGMKRRADGNVDVLDSIFPNYKRQRTEGTKAAFNERFDQPSMSAAIKASNEDRGPAERRYNADNYTLLSHGANRIFTDEIKRQLREFQETGNSRGSPFFRTSQRGFYDVQSGAVFNVAASKEESNDYVIPDSRSGRMIVPKVYDVDYTKPRFQNPEDFNVSASAIDQTFMQDENAKYGRLGSSVISSVIIGGIVDWNSSMMVGSRDDEGMTGAHSVMASSFDVSTEFGRCAVLASDHFPCDMESLEKNEHLSNMAKRWANSPMFKDLSYKDAAVMEILYRAPHMGYLQTASA